jgi:hypothetical protein
MSSRATKIAVTAAAAVLGATGAGVLAGPAGASTAPSARAAACDKTPWEAKVQGAPKGFGAGSPSGDYLWRDTSGFHLRVTHVNHDQRVYTGQITSSAAMRVDPVKLERGDSAKLSANHHTLTFVFANHGYIDGVNFHTDCASALAVSRLYVGNRDIDTGHVDLGYTKAHPAHVPFVVHRVPTTA